MATNSATLCFISWLLCPTAKCDMHSRNTITTHAIGKKSR